MSTTPSITVSPAWPVPVSLHASAAAHLLAVGVAVVDPQAWPWALGAVAGNHALLTAAGLWPRSGWLGPNLSRLGHASSARGEVALTFDDGPDPEVTPRVLDLLDEAGARATFFCIAERARAQPALVRAIVDRGHSVQNHSHRHRHTFSLLGPGGFDAELRRSQDILADLAGTRPTCFRAPAGLRNPFLDPMLHRHGLRLVSWTRRGFDTREPSASVVAARLARGLAGGDILLLHDGNAARDTCGDPVVLDVLPRLLRSMQAAGVHGVTLAHALADRCA